MKDGIEEFTDTCLRLDVDPIPLVLSQMPSAPESRNAGDVSIVRRKPISKSAGPPAS